MWIYNITFFTHRQLRESLTADLRGAFREAAEKEGLARMEEIALVAETQAGAGQEGAVSLGVRFRTEQLETWRKHILPAALALIDERYGENAMHFDTVLEPIDM